MAEMAKKREENQTIKMDNGNSLVETVDMREINKQKILNYYRNISDLPKNFLEQTFDNSICKNDIEKKHKESFIRFCNNFEKIRNTGLGIFLSGREGTGKTYYSLAIYNELSKNYKVYRTSLSGIFNRIKKTYSKLSNVTDDIVFKDILECDLLILDDLGNEYISEEWGKEKLFTFFNMLYENEISVIISTNLDTEQLRKFTDIHGSGKIIDRIKERCKPYAFDWESRRANINKKYFEELY